MPDVLSSKPELVFLNCWDFVERFEYGLEDGKSWVARFTLFDPYFDYLLPRFITAFLDQQRLRVYFQFGWIVDGLVTRMSDVKSGLVMQAVPTFLQDGVRIELEVLAPETTVKSLEKAERQWKPGTSVEEIVRDVLSMPHPTLSALNNGVAPLVVETPVPCEPLTNAGNGVVMGTYAPLTWLRSFLLQYAVPKDPKLKGRPVRLWEKDREQGKFVLAPEGWQGFRTEIKRTYHVGRGQSAQVIEFTPADNAQIATQLGGEGYTTSVSSADKRVYEHVRSGVTAQPEKKENHPKQEMTAVRFSGASFARDLDKAALERTRQWADAQALAVQADLTVLGDPHIYLNDYIDVNVYMGGTLNTAGKRLDDSLRLVPYMSGQYFVLGYTHRIEGGQYTTSMKLTRAHQEVQANPASPSHSDDSQRIAPLPAPTSLPIGVDLTI